MTLHTIPVGSIGTNCYIAADENTKACVVIDPGDEPVKLLDYISGQGYTVHYIFLTHGHYDHIMGVPLLREKTGAKLVIHQADADCLSNPSRSYAQGLVAIAPPEILAGEGTTITVDSLVFHWLSTPGHTVGSSVILCGDVMFSGDTLFFEECGRCDLHGGDFASMLTSLKRLSQLSGDYTVYPGHGQHSALSHERSHNPYMIQAQ